MFYFYFFLNKNNKIKFQEVYVILLIAKAYVVSRFNYKNN